MKNKKCILYIVVPCYNEEEVLPISSEILKNKINDLIDKKVINKKSKILFVDDGSKDNTWNLIEKFNKENDLFSGIKLSKNKGHQIALLAGLVYSKDFADITISIDADLQDDVDAIDKMIEEYKNGSYVVYGVRSSRKKDSFFKRNSAQAFYHVMNKMGTNVIYNHADFRLLSKEVLECLSEYGETNLFLRGIVPEIGYKSSIVYYERKERLAGESKYPLKKMLYFAIDGITSFSVKPLKLITYIGLLIAVFSFAIMVYTLCVKFAGRTVQGWTFIMISIWLIGGIQMLCLGIIGEYIGKTYSESKKRPRYFIEKTL